MSEINFYNIDNIEFMKTKPDNYYDLAIVDPPYGINMGFDGWDKKAKKAINKQREKNWDNETPTKEYFNELMRVSKNQIIWGGNYFIEFLYNTTCFLSWDKMNGTNNMADFELAWTSFGTACRRFEMHHFSSGYEKKIHPTQKPTKLYRWQLLKYAEKGNKILDTHGGSMTIAKACDMEGFDLDICEIDAEYFKDGKKAFKEYKSQTKLF